MFTGDAHTAEAERNTVTITTTDRQKQQRTTMKHVTVNRQHNNNVQTVYNIEYIFSVMMADDRFQLILTADTINNTYVSILNREYRFVLHN